MAKAKLDLKVKRIYETPARGDGTRILVDRVWPRGLSKARAKLDFWCKEVAPTTALRRWYGHRVERWPAFREKYRDELEANASAVDELLANIGAHHATLLYAARDEEHNNAVALAEYLGAPRRKRKEPAQTKRDKP